MVAPSSSLASRAATFFAASSDAAITFLHARASRGEAATVSPAASAAAKRSGVQRMTTTIRATGTRRAGYVVPPTS